jgi:hypothetical protein
MTDVDFNSVFMGMGISLDNSGIIDMDGINMMIISARGVIISTVTIMLSLVEILGTIKLQISTFQGKNDLNVYLEGEKKVEWIF